MSAGLAEQLTPQQTHMEGPHLHAVPDPDEAPQVAVVRSVHEAASEALARMRFESWTGSLAVSASAEAGEAPAEVNFLERLQAARDGDSEARKWVEANADTAIFEAVFKDGYIGETYMDRTADGRLSQHGQTNDEIYHNAMALRPGRHRVLKDITRAEALNRHRIEAELEAGGLKDDYYVVFSLVPEGVPEEQLGAEGDGYFLDGLTLSVQATTESAGGRVKTESAFVKGVEEQGDDTFAARMSRRHDFKAVARLYERLGHRAPGLAAEILGEGLYIPKEMMPNGVSDVVYWLDVAKDEVLGHEEERRPEDYAGLRLESKRKEASLADVREKVVEDLLEDAPRLETPMEAVQKLWDLVKEHATEASFSNMNIDPGVFGRKAASHIRRARQHISKGDLKTAATYMRMAHAQSEITGCGGGAMQAKASRSSGGGDSLDHVAGSDEYGSKAFMCSNGHLNIRPHNGFVDNCQHTDCGAAVAC